MKKIFKGIADFIKAINDVICFLSALVTLIGVVGYVCDYFKEKAKCFCNEACVGIEAEDSLEEEYESDLDQFLFKRSMKNG